MQYVDEITVKALELRAPRFCTRDAGDLRAQLLGGTIFSAFSERDRAGIWVRLQAVDGLIPSLYALFENVNYLKALAACMTRLVRPSLGDTVSTALFKAFSDINQRADRAVIQITEPGFSSSPASSADRADLGVRQLYAYAMRHYLQMPRDLKGKELLARHTTNADRTVLREFADLAERLGFESPEIIALKEHPHARDARNPSENSKPLLVTDGAGVKKKRRCGLPSVEEYLEDSESLFINHLHDVDEEQGEGITSFFVRKSIYSAFFGKPSPLPLEGLHPRNNAVEGGQTLERQELERQELERQEQERQELERQEQERQELERQELERQELERQELERRELERREQERQDLERQELERQDLERQEQERQELERQELERQELERQELERQELERRELERREQERQELERREQERQELERREQERQELERQKLEKQRQEGRDQEEKAKQQQAKRTQARKEHHGRLQRVKLKKIHQGRPREQAHEREEWQRPQNPNLEDERKLEDQQRIGLDELLDIDQDVDLQPGEDIQAESSGARLEEASSNTTVRINFKICDRGIWKPASAHTIERSDSSEIEKAAMNWIRGKWRLFNTELRMLAPQQCYDAVIADGTYTILLIRESEIAIDSELLLSAMDIGIEANEQGRCFETQEGLDEIS